MVLRVENSPKSPILIRKSKHSSHALQCVLLQEVTCWKQVSASHADDKVSANGLTTTRDVGRRERHG